MKEGIAAEKYIVDLCQEQAQISNVTVGPGHQVCCSKFILLHNLNGNTTQNIIHAVL